VYSVLEQVSPVVARKHFRGFRGQTLRVVWNRIHLGWVSVARMRSKCQSLQGDVVERRQEQASLETWQDLHSGLFLMFPTEVFDFVPS
jgi:hypothetical protein